MVFKVKNALGAECELAISEPDQRLLSQLQVRGRSAVIRVIVLTSFSSCGTGKGLALVGKLAQIIPLSCICLMEVEQKEVMLALLTTHEALEIAAVLSLDYRGSQLQLRTIERVLKDDFLRVQMLGQTHV